MLMMIISLIGAHCLLDYAGQGDFMSKAKNPAAPIPGIPWLPVMLAHSAIHGAAVALITGFPVLFFAESAAHFATDVAKCKGRIGFVADQVIHIACKLAWACIAAVGLPLFDGV